MTSSGNTVTDNQHIVNMLEVSFSPGLWLLKTLLITLPDCNITTSKVCNALHLLKQVKYYPKLLKDTESKMLVPLTFFFNLPFRNGKIIPADREMANITPSFKKITSKY